jgi:hypothetical protein
MAAGLGFKTFTTGEVLTAADTNGYLMQGVLVFADAAARTAAITSPQEGQVTYLKDTDLMQTYSGSAWVSVGGAAPASAVNFVATQQSTSSTSYTGLTTAQAVTVTTGTKALVIVSARIFPSANAYTAYMSAAVSGATTRAASDDWALQNFWEPLAASYVTLMTGLTAGSNTFTAQFRISSTTTANFSNRTLVVIDMGS